ncbi:DEAD/DEAH box helicase family protein [Lacibacter sp.]|uniref:DEAD/DEAH box helicase family protein n=1 Tax=Lacibacter sp. TaxID=1915409 RepID=UPI002B4B66E6|nr:DEAD/DEAH box helicase family protein [Lacibacter sp.]HLP39831.1 DEAD/DEAH box helicase family protein [Lacibacter sp.]
MASGGQFKPVAGGQFEWIFHYCAILCRKSLEQFVKWLYDHDEDLEIPADTTLNSLMHEQSFKTLIPLALFRNINLIRKIGNNAAHGTQRTDRRDALASLKILHDFSLWVVRLYSRSQTPVTIFDETILPEGDAVERTRQQLQQLAEQYEQVQQQLVRANEELLRNAHGATVLQQQLLETKTIKQENIAQATTVPLSISEAETRRIYIDALLKEAGWNLSLPNVLEFEVKGMPHDGGIGYADYVLWGDDGKPLAVVEAKRTLIDAYKGKRQAELYANCLEAMFGQRPVIFYSNGFETNLWDDQFYPPRQVQGFYTKDELQLIINRREIRKRLSETDLNKEIAGRYYQEEAIKRVQETLEKKARGALLVMATGSGKTRTAAALTDILTKANWAKKILFLADRNALVTQAKNAFNTLLPQLTAIDLTKEDEDTASRIVFSTYPTIMNRIDSVKQEGKRYYGPGHFDVVIIDEAHRSVYMKYRAIFEYFDAIYIGLTATPKSETDKDTYELFGLEVHNPTFAYELDTAVSDGYLVPPQAMKVPVRFPREGVKYNELTEAEKREYEQEFLENYGEIPDEVANTAVNTWFFNKDTVNKVLDLVMQRGQKIEGGDLIGKTIVFAKNHHHAVFIEKCFNERYPQYNGKLLRVIDNQVYNAQDMIYSFSDAANKEFQIAVSVDMLDTGIDIPEVLNLVFFKTVRSKAKFWQMVGRGTRLCPDVFGEGMDKECFFIFDVCGNLEFFSSNIDEAETVVRGTLSQQIFMAKLNVAFLLETKAAGGNSAALKQELLDELHHAVCEFRDDDFRVRMHLQYVEKYRNKDAWNSLSVLDVIEIEKHLSYLYNDTISDESARWFDLLMLNYILSAEEQSGRQRHYEAKIKEATRGLLKKLSIPEVKQQEHLIRFVQDDEYWQGSEAQRHNDTRLALRNLIKYIEAKQRPHIYTNFTDEIGEVEELQIIAQYQELGAYKKRVEKFLRENQHHITIHRIRQNIPITQQELVELQRLLFSIDEHGNEELLSKVTKGQPLVVFIRSILGLDVNAAKEAFGEFLAQGNLNSTQINFINSIINYLSVNGQIDKKMLFEKPFTDIDDRGISGVFSLEQAGNVIRIIDRLNQAAVK